MTSAATRLADRIASVDADALEALRLLSDADHLCVLSSVDPAELGSGSPLNYPQHIVLRDVYRCFGEEAAREWLRDPSRRPALLRDLVAKRRGVDYSALQRFGIDPDKVTLKKGAALGAVRDLVPEAAEGIRLGDHIVWADRRSFACMKVGSARTLYGHVFTVTAEVAASTLGRGYYAFTAKGETGFFLHEDSIAVVALGYEHLVAGQQAPTGLSKTELIGVDKLRGALAASKEDAREMFMRMVATHEIGHTLALRDSAPIRDIISRAGHDPDDAFRYGFPTWHQLLAWRRMRDGLVTIKDLTFVLGDVLANATVFLSGVEQPVKEFHKQYLWQVITPPRGDGAPRGMLTSLRVGEGLAPEPFLNGLERLFAAAVSAPDTVVPLIRTQEADSWALLAEKYELR